MGKGNASERCQYHVQGGTRHQRQCGDACCASALLHNRCFLIKSQQSSFLLKLCRLLCLGPNISVRQTLVIVNAFEVWKLIPRPCAIDGRQVALWRGTTLQDFYEEEIMGCYSDEECYGCEFSISTRL